VNPDMASTGKAYTSIACGIMLREFRRKIPEGLDQEVFTPAYLPEAFPLDDPRKAQITLGQLLCMSAGFHGEGGSPGIVGQAGLLTFSTFGVLSLYAVLSKRDFSAWGSFFIVGLWVLIATSLLNMFVGSALGSLWIAAGTVLVFSGLLVFDTWRIVRSGVYGPDDYVPAAVMIYLDLLNLFIGILSLLNGRRRS